jgi:hypothetical protein
MSPPKSCFEPRRSASAVMARPEDVETHRGEPRPRRVRRNRRLLQEAGHALPGVAFDDAEAARLAGGDGDDGHRGVGFVLDVEVEHLAHVHPVDVVRPEHRDVGGALVLDQVQVLHHGVGAALEEAWAQVHRRRDRGDVVAHLWRELPAAGQMLHQRASLVLRDDVQLVDARVDEVRQHDVDDAIAAAEGHRRLGAVTRERVEPLSFSAGQDDADDGRAVRRAHRNGPSYSLATVPPKGGGR